MKRNTPQLAWMKAALATVTALASGQASATTDVTVPSAGTTIANSATSFTKKSTKFGDFGVGYTAGYSVSSSSSQQSSTAYGSVDAELFGNKQSVVSGTATAKTNASNSLTYSLSIMGATVLTSPSSGTLSNLSVEGPEKCLDFFNEEQVIDIVVVPVTLKAEAKGCINLNFSGAISSTSSTASLSFTATPGASAAATASIALGVDAFSTGVEGTLDLISLSTPVTASLNYAPATSKLTYGLNGTLSLTTLDGSIALYAKALFLKYTYTLLNWNGYSLASKVLFSDSVPVAADVELDLSSGTEAASSHAYSDSSNLPESGTVYTWYRASDATGTGSASVGSSTSLSSWTFSGDDNNKYLKVCVTPNNGANSGTQVCSDWSAVGHTLSLWKNANYGSSTYTWAYENTQSGTCYAVTGSYKDDISSYKFYAPSNYGATLLFYNDANCSGRTATRNIGAGGNDLVPSVSTYVGSDFQDAISSFRVVFNDVVTASDVSLVFSSNKAQGSYTFSGSSDVAESGTTYTLSRATDANGSGATTLSTSSSWTLVSADESKYLRFCVTPSDGYATGSQVCSAWTAVKHLVQFFKDSSYGGSTIDIPYENSSSGSCFNMTDLSFNDAASSLTWQSPSSGSAATLWIYKDKDCSGTSATLTISGSGSHVMSYASIANSVSSSWNDSISSFKVTY